jgi:hypothetical protein
MPEDDLDDLRRRVNRTVPHGFGGTHTIEPRRDEDHGVPKKISRKARRRRTRRRLKRLVGLPAKARFREDAGQEPGTASLGSSWVEDSGGGKYSISNLGPTSGAIHVRRCWDEIHFPTDYDGWNDSPRYLCGGPFHKYDLSQPNTVQGVGRYHGADFRPYGFLEVYEGGFIPANWSHGYSATDLFSAGLSGPLGPSYESALPYGAEAYNRYRPKLSSSDMGTALGEIREFPGMIKETARTMSLAYSAAVGRAYGSSQARRSAMRSVFMPKAVAKSFLNEQFGWVPFVRDLVSFYNTYQVLDERIAQVQRDSGRWIKRGGTVKTIDETSDPVIVEDLSGVVYPSLLSGFYHPTYRYSKHVKSTLYKRRKVDVWFSGQFSYYVPKYDVGGGPEKDTYGYVMAVAREYGLRVSPSLIWNLTPWSWLADWKTNIGDVIDNVSATFLDYLVSKYAYVMAHSRVKIVNESEIRLNAGTVRCNWSQDIEVKHREQANPFGFTLSNDDLSVRQKAILVALGLTRAL